MNIFLIEITVSYTTSTYSKHVEKINRYQALKQLLMSKGYSVDLFCIEISSTRIFLSQSINDLKDILKKLKLKNINLIHKKIIRFMRKIVLIASYVIFKEKKHLQWINLPMIQSNFSFR